MDRSILFLRRHPAVRFLKRKRVFDIANIALVSHSVARQVRYALETCVHVIPVHADMREHTVGCAHLLHASPLFIFRNRICKKPSFAYVIAHGSNREFAGQIAWNFEADAGKSCKK